MSEKAAGWYPDPSGDNQQRFWDGDSWTEYYQPLMPQHAPTHDASTAMEDYPYLTASSGSMTTPHIPPPEGWSAPTNAWSTPQQTTAWGTPASTQDYAGSYYRPPEYRDPRDGTQVYRSGTQGNQGGRGGVIAAVVASVVVVGLLIVGGILAFRNGDGVTAGSSGDAEEGVVEVGEVAEGSVPSDGEWVGALTIADSGAHLVDARAIDGNDLRMGVRDSTGTTLAYNDDRGRMLHRGAHHLDPLVVFDLEPGDYEIVITEFRDRPTDFTVEVQEFTEEIGLDESVEVHLGEEEEYLAVLEVADDVEIVIDVQGQGASDPTLTVRSLERDAMWSNDDRGDGSRDPLLEDLELRAGRYAVMVTEYFGHAATIQISITS